MNEKKPCDFCKGTGIEPGHTDCAWCDSTGVLGGLSPAPVPPVVPAAWDDKALELAGKAYQQINAYAHRDRGYLVSVIQCSIISGMNFANADREAGLAREAALRATGEIFAGAVGVLDKRNAELKALQQRLAEAEKDAARYRFLRDGERGGLEYWDGEPCVATEEMTHFYDDLDQVIDCAIEGMAERLASPGCADGEKAQ